MMDSIKAVSTSLDALTKTLAEYRGGGRVIYWILGIVSTIAVALMIRFLTGH